MRRLAFLAVLAGWAPGGHAQPVVTSAGPTASSVTVYRDPNGAGRMELGWLNGFAMISETRRVSLPAGESDLRFEGVASGLIPQSAVVEGLGEAVVETNRDARLLSPGTLFLSGLGKRVHLRRTSKATGEVVEQEAVIRAAGDGVVIETEGGFEALRCTGLAETLLLPEVPADLSAKPTLSVRLRSPSAVDATVRLTYITTGFDWRANYVATLLPDGKTLSLFAWLTLANGDETSFRDAEAMVVAGKLNREEVARLRPDVRPVSLDCWPSQRTHEIPADPLGGAPPPPPPPPAPPMAPSPVSLARAESIVVTGSRIMAQREALGDLKLYRVPIAVTVASRSQKQVALLEQPSVKAERFYRWRTFLDEERGPPDTLTQVLRMENRQRDGLGLPLPAGELVLYTQHEGRPFLLGEGRMTDRAVGERVDVTLSAAPGVMASQKVADRGNGVRETEILLSNDLPVPARAEIEIIDDEELKVLGSPERLKRRDGKRFWDTIVPANGSRRLVVRHRRRD